MTLTRASTAAQVVRTVLQRTSVRPVWTLGGCRYSSSSSERTFFSMTSKDFAASPPDDGKTETAKTSPVLTKSDIIRMVADEHEL